MDESRTALPYSSTTNISHDVSLTMPAAVNLTLREWSLILGLSLMILCVIFGNFLILAAVFKHRPLQTPPVYLIASLAVADLMVGLMVMPLSLIHEVTVEWKLGFVLCDFWISLDVLCCTASILNLCVIALDRYWAITKPLKYKQKRTPLRMLAMIAVVWAISLVISTTPLFGWREDSPDPKTCMISQNRIYTIFSTFGAFFIPMTIMLVVYARIFMEARKRIHGKTNLVRTPLSSNCATPVRSPVCDLPFKIASKIRRISTSEPVINELDSPNTMLQPPVKYNGHRRQSSPGLTSPKASNLRYPDHARCESLSVQPSPDHNRTVSLSVHPSSYENSQTLPVPCSPFIQQRLMQRRNLASAREQKAVKTLAIITGTFLICWLPFFITALVLPFCQECHLPSFWKSLFLWLGYFNSMINPILYTKFNRDFKDAFSKLLRCSNRRSPNHRPLQLSPYRVNGVRKTTSSQRTLCRNGSDESRL